MGPPSRLLAALSTSGAGDLAGFQTGGTHVLALRGAPDQGTDALNIRVPAPLGATVGVRHVVPEARALAADVTRGSHRTLLR